MNEISNMTAQPISASSEQSAFVSGLLDRQDEVLEELAELERRVDLVIEAISRERAAEDGIDEMVLAPEGDQLPEVEVDVRHEFGSDECASKAA